VDGLGAPRAGQEVGQLPEASHSDHREGIDQRCLIGVLAGNDHAAMAGSQRGVGDRERAAHRLDGAVQTQLAKDGEGCERLPVHLGARAQHRGGERQIESRPCLSQVRGREVDRYPPKGKLEAAVEKRRAHALARFLHSRVGETDDRECRQPRMDVGFDGDLDGLDSDRGERRHAREHRADLTWRALAGCSTLGTASREECADSSGEPYRRRKP
jgi:hypothetical protein